MISYLRLLRLPNVVTAAADVISGMFIASSLGYEKWSLSFWPLVLASCLLYAGGVVLNDTIDTPNDLWEHPERPLPSGKITRAEAGLVSIFFLFSGMFCASLINSLSFNVAAALVIIIVLYNLWLKNLPVLRNVTMGLCRSLNFFLGFTILSEKVLDYYWLAFLPLVHTVAITSLSSGETSGLSRGKVFLVTTIPSFFLTTSLVLINIFRQNFFREAWFFISLYFIAVTFAFLPAVLIPQARFVNRGVKYGILSLVLLDATLVTIFCGWFKGVFIALFMLFSWLLARFILMT